MTKANRPFALILAAVAVVSLWIPTLTMPVAQATVLLAPALA